VLVVAYSGDTTPRNLDRNRYGDDFPTTSSGTGSFHRLAATNITVARGSGGNLDHHDHSQGGGYTGTVQFSLSPRPAPDIQNDTLHRVETMRR